MNCIKHTPGPWINAATAITAKGGLDFVVAYLPSLRGATVGSDEWCANARLIEAAPVLLEAVTRLLNESRPVYSIDEWRADREFARAAIALATKDPQ